MRKIPVTMATQHPDNAFKSPFSDTPFVNSKEEILECFQCFSELGVDEYMWDWEGKFVDEAVIDRLYQNYYEYFKNNALGKQKFLTFRIPNIWEESSYRLQRAFMNLIAAEQAAKKFGMHTPPLFEIILPMTTRADQLTYLQETFVKIAHATKEIFDAETEMKHVEVIPLFEQAETMAESDQILEEYVNFLQEKYGFKPEYLRIFIARSDPAMNAGYLPCLLAVKSAISSYHAFGEKHGIEIFPWVGGGSLPFRGGINPENIDNVIAEYKGISSLTVQSAFRFDYPESMVKKAIGELNIRIPQNRKNFIKISEEERQKISEFNAKAIPLFQKTVEEIAPFINKIAEKMPNHRERVQHIGMFGYSRGVGKVKLPRAIKFTGALYSIGVPPEFIATGRVLKLAKETGFFPLIEKLCVNWKADLRHAGHYFCAENLDLLCSRNSAWNDLKEDISLVEEFLGEKIGPCKSHHFIHRNFASNIFHKIHGDEDISEDILQAARVRKSLG